MPEPFNSKPRTSRGKKSTPPEDPQEEAYHLQLVVSNPPPVQETPPSEPTPSNAGFTAEVRKRGFQLYEMNIEDPFHDLACDLILDIEEKGSEATAVCHFPDILDETNKFLDEDETLYGIIMVQFQMKILEQLFLFCADHEARQLIIYMDGAQAEGFGIYDDFLTYYDETLDEKGKQTEILIQINQQTLKTLQNFMKKTNLEFRQDLWREQRSNPAIRRYLKSHPLA